MDWNNEKNHSGIDGLTKFRQLVGIKMEWNKDWSTLVYYRLIIVVVWMKCTAALVVYTSNVCLIWYIPILYETAKEIECYNNDIKI